MRITQKNIIYSSQGLMSSNVPLLSSMCLRSPDEISPLKVSQSTVLLGSKAGRVHFGNSSQGFKCSLVIKHCYLKGIM